jgi:hypothetical protein
MKLMYALNAFAALTVAVTWLGMDARPAPRWAGQIFQFPVKKQGEDS